MSKPDIVEALGGCVCEFKCITLQDAEGLEAWLIESAAKVRKSLASCAAGIGNARVYVSLSVSVPDYKTPPSESAQ